MNNLHGSFFRLGERHEIAIYVRDGVPYLAEFRSGHGELYGVGAWFSLHSRGSALRRAAPEPVMPIPPEVAERIERLHRVTGAKFNNGFMGGLVAMAGVRLAAAYRTMTDIRLRTLF
jgi:hypothetical protein